MRVEYKGKVFSREDFTSITDSLSGHFLAVIEALVQPQDDFIDIEIVSVKIDPSGREVSAHLKLDVERELETLMRTVYLNEVRKGLEGDMHHEHPDDVA